MGRPFMTGRIHYTPEAEQQLNEIDDWIAANATADIARRFISAILERIDVPRSAFCASMAPGSC